MTNLLDVLKQNGRDNSLLQECKYQYLDLDDDYNLVGVTGKGKFNVVHLNVHSLSAKQLSLSFLLIDLDSKECHVHVLLLCETYLSKLNLKECGIMGYNLVHESRSDNKKGGGVAILIDKNFNIKYVMI